MAPATATAQVMTSDRRMPSIAAVEWAYAVFQIKRDLSELTWFQRLMFTHVWLRIMRFAVLRLGLPLVEKIDKLPCPGCGASITVEGGGCWTEKEGIVTTREKAVDACKTSDWYFHRLRVNAPMSGETARTRVDHDFAKANTKQYRAVSEDAYDGSLSRLEGLNHQIGGALNKARELNSATQ